MKAHGILLLSFALAISACQLDTTISFDQGIKQLRAWDFEYGSGMVSVPNSTESISTLHETMVGYRASHTFDADIAALIDYRILILNAKSRYDEGWKYGRKGTTQFGFGCKDMYGKVKESASLRNESATIGAEGVIMLQSFIDTYPEKSKSLNLTQRDVLILKAIYFEIGEIAQKDDSVITHFCKDKVNQSENGP